MTLENLLASIQPLSQEAMAAAKLRQAALAKPPESLGRLEELSIQLAGITGAWQAPHRSEWPGWLAPWSWRVP